MKKRSDPVLFGTDGIRSEYGTFPLDPGSIGKLGSAITSSFGPSRILVGRDTRMSGGEIEDQLIKGMDARSGVFSAGVIPTPALSYNIVNGGFDLGIMITASHNPWKDNGIKIFGPDGEKLSDPEQERLTGMFYDGGPVSPEKTDVTVQPYEGNRKYSDYLGSVFVNLETAPSGILLDCANGAVSQTAPEIFSRLGIPHRTYNASPDGMNINDGCGSTVPEFLAEKISRGEGSFGIAFDGDGDRVLMVNSSGEVLDGDVLLFVISKFLKLSDPSFPPLVVGTVMSNLGLEKELNRSGIGFLRSDVGDRHVYELMKRETAELGGEQSGHIIYRKFQRTGDGILTALLFLKAIGVLGLTPDEAGRSFRPYPQETRNIRIREKRDLASWTELNRMVRDFNEKFGNNSRILIRYSGTEKKIRLMIESEDERIIKNNLGVFEAFLISGIGELP